MKTQSRQNPLQWIQKNLFNSPVNTVLTLICIWIIWGFGSALFAWLSQSQWAVISENLRLFLVGRYPDAQMWRMVTIALIPVVIASSWIASNQISKRSQTWNYLLIPIGIAAIAWLANGGLGLPLMRSSLWGGLFLTLFTAAISIVLAFPLGLLLALGRKSELPVIRWVSTIYIELVRGLPLIGILFMAQVMLPLVLPFRFDRLLRAVLGLTFFNAAYLAENIRSGLQTLPSGQAEAARSLGLNSIQTLRFVVLPQALRLVVPAIVGQFISLFKDTSLLALFALFELTGIARSILSQPQFIGRNGEVYLFIGLIYWIFCFGLSQFSKRLELTKD
jgi:general L-amino acid transport system permease protein